MVSACIIQEELEVGGHRLFKTDPDIGHITEVHEGPGGVLFHAGPDPAVNEAAPEQIFRRAHGYRVIRTGAQVPPSIRVQEQIIALEQDYAAVDGDSILDGIVQQAVVERPGAHLA